MKLRMALLSVSAVLLTACASTGEKTSYVPQVRSAYPESQIAADDAYMARVEFLARRRGINLTWVNPPRKVATEK